MDARARHRFPIGAAARLGRNASASPGCWWRGAFGASGSTGELQSFEEGTQGVGRAVAAGVAVGV
jgi:hypothetical protein